MTGNKRQLTYDGKRRRISALVMGDGALCYGALEIVGLLLLLLFIISVCMCVGKSVWVRVCVCECVCTRSPDFVRTFWWRNTNVDRTCATLWGHFAVLARLTSYLYSLTYTECVHAVSWHRRVCVCMCVCVGACVCAMGILCKLSVQIRTVTVTFCWWDRLRS